MRRTVAILLLAGAALLGSCGKAADTQVTSESIQESTGNAETSVSDSEKSSPVAEAEGVAEESSGENEAAVEEESDKADNEHHISGVEISFDFSRMSTKASNQIAAWIEDENGNIVKTIYVSDFTGSRHGYQKREDAVPHWVSAAEPDALSDEQIDAVSSATLQTGSQSFVWDLTDDDGNAVPTGIYMVKLEGTLFWSSNVVYSGTVDTQNDAPGEIDVREERSEPDNTDNEDMIQNVKMTETGE